LDPIRVFAPRVERANMGGNSLFLAEYSTKDLSFNCFAFEKQGFYILLMFQVLDGIHGGQEAVTWRMETEWR
jgi:hypothetical protein